MNPLSDKTDDKMDDKKFQKMLVEAYQTCGHGDVSPHWRRDLMRKVRAIGPLNRQKSTGPLFQDLVWRLAPAMSILLLILITGMFTMDFSFLQETFMEDPVAVIYNGIIWG